MRETAHAHYDWGTGYKSLVMPYVPYKECEWRVVERS